MWLNLFTFDHRPVKGCLLGVVLTVMAPWCSATVIFKGMCDASGAIPLSATEFMVADDEDNRLRVYNADTGGDPVREYSLTSDASDGVRLVRSDETAIAGKKELDLEAATLVDGLSFWLTSHARNKKGRYRPERFRFFALRVDTHSHQLRLEGAPYDDLLPAMAQHGEYHRYEFDKRSRGGAEQDDALNIEGMTARAGGGVFIGFRNPVPQGKALIIVLENPEQLVTGAQPRFGPSYLLDLKGLGVRGLSSWKGQYLVAAGAVADSGGSVLYKWKGDHREPVEVKGQWPEGFNPEAFFTPENRGEFMVLSDDGSREIAGKDCKKLDDESQKYFRGIWLNSV